MEPSPVPPPDAPTPDLSSVVLFMRRTAHDLNNALAAACMNADLLLADFPPEDPRREIVQDIADGARRATRLTSELSRYAKEVDQATAEDHGAEASDSENPRS